MTAARLTTLAAIACLVRWGLPALIEWTCSWAGEEE